MSRVEISGAVGQPVHFVMDGRAFTPAAIDRLAAHGLLNASRYPTYLIEDWPRIRAILDQVALSANSPEIGPTPVLSAPMVRLLCLVVGMHALLVPFERFAASAIEKEHLEAGAATAGPILDWPILGGLLYRIADTLGLGGVPYAGNLPGVHFSYTFAEGGAFRLLSRLLLEHVDVTS